jgi:hypothetical protein
VQLRLAKNSKERFNARRWNDRVHEESNRARGGLLTEHGIPIPAIQTQGPTLVQSVCRREKAS